MSMVLELVGSAIVLLWVIFVAPLLDGVRRKIYARIQRRVGPPVLQTYYDLAKLFSRRSIGPSTPSPGARIAPLASILYVATASLLVYSVELNKLLGGVVGFVMLVAGSTVMLILGVLGSSPYTSIGASRLLLLGAVIEPSTLIALYASSLSAGYAGYMSAIITRSVNWLVALASSLSLAVTAYAESELSPFSIGEAPTEIASGYLAEYGGRHLALALMSCLSRFTLISIVAVLPLASLVARGFYGLLVALALSVMLTLIIYFVSAMYGRPTPLRALGYAVAAYAIGVVALVLALYYSSSPLL